MVTTAPATRPRAASFTDDAVEVIVARPDVGSEAVSASARLLSDLERARAGRFAFEPDRNRFIVARALLRQLLAARLGVRPEAVELASGARGKPALAGRFATSDLRFNVSHCKDVAVYALSSRRKWASTWRRCARSPMPTTSPPGGFLLANTPRTAGSSRASGRWDSSSAGLARKRSSRRWATACSIRSIASTYRWRRASRPRFSGSRTCRGTAARGAWRRSRPCRASWRPW